MFGRLIDAIDAGRCTRIEILLDCLDLVAEFDRCLIAPPRFFREALEAIRRGDISARDFVTEEIRLADLPQAFARMKSRSGEIKLAVRP